MASKGLGVVGAFQNLNQTWQEGEWNLRDTGQIALGLGLMIPGLNGGIVIAGGAVLFGWELYELMNE